MVGALLGVVITTTTPMEIVFLAIQITGDCYHRPVSPREKTARELAA
jgi:hypothetical protein